MVDNGAVSICPLCSQDEIVVYCEDEHRPYYQCNNCHLVYVPKQFHLDADQEKLRYDTHNNDPEDIRYRNFLGRLFYPMVGLLTPPLSGLDFGSGPGPTLSVMFEEKGFSMNIYDPYYAPGKVNLNQSYDFITVTEVVEHFSNPGKELQRLFSMLRPKGLLGIMTNRLVDIENFPSWYYKRDPTHIAFYATDTFKWLSEEYNAEIIFDEGNTIIFRK